MSQLRKTRSISWPLVILLVLSPLLAHLGLASQKATAVVLRVTGVAQVTRSGASGRERLSQGDLLRDGDTIEVTRNSEVLIGLASGSRVRIGSSSRVTLGSVEVSRAELNAWYGSVLSAIDRSADPGYDYRVSTPTSSAAIRGTVFLTEVAEGSGETTYQVLTGEVLTISEGFPEEVLLTEGMKITATTGLPLAAPVAMSSAEIGVLKNMAVELLGLDLLGVGAGAAATGTAVAGTSNWLLWTIIGAVVVGGVTGGLILLGGDDGDGDGLPEPPPPPDR